MCNWIKHYYNKYFKCCKNKKKDKGFDFKYTYYDIR